MANNVINPTIYRITDAVLQEKTVTTNGVVLPDAGYDGLSKVSVYVQGDSGLNLNGIIKRCQVNDGASVTAGDFVELLSRYGNGEFHNTGEISDLAAVALSDNHVLVLFCDHENSDYGTAKILTIDGANVSVSKEMVFNEAETTHISAAVLSRNRVMVVFGEGINQDFGYAVIITIEGTSISIGEKVEFLDRRSGISSHRMFNPSVLLLTDNKVLITYEHSHYSNYRTTQDACARVLNVDGATINVGAQKAFGYGNISAAKLSDSEVLVTYEGSSDGDTTQSRLIKIDGDNLVLGEYTSLYDEYNNPRSNNAKLVALSDNKALFACSAGRYGNIAAMVLTVENSYVHLGTLVYWGSSFDSWDYLSVAVLSENTAVLSCKGTSVVLTIDGTTVSYGEELTYFVDKNNASTGGYQALLAFSPNDALVLSEANIVGYYRSLHVEGDTITLQDTNAANGTFVQTTANPTRIMGVANTSGSEGEMVEVYCLG